MAVRGLAQVGGGDTLQQAFVGGDLPPIDPGTDGGDDPSQVPTQGAAPYQKPYAVIDPATAYPSSTVDSEQAVGGTISPPGTATGAPAGSSQGGYATWMDQPGLSYQDIFARTGNPTYAQMEWQAYQQQQQLPPGQQSLQSAIDYTNTAAQNTPGALPNAAPGGMQGALPAPTQAPSDGSQDTTAPTPTNGAGTAGAAQNPALAAMPSPTQLGGFAPQPFQNFGNIPYINPATYNPAQAQSSAYGASTYSPDMMGSASYNASTYGPSQFNASTYDPASFNAANQGSAAYNATGYNATNQGAAGVDLAQMPGALQSFEKMNKQALKPEFQAQKMSLDDNLGSRGIVNSGAATYLNNQLAGQQDAALASADAPLINAFAGYYNQGEESNAGYQQQAITNNAAAQNAASATNASAQNAASATNAGFTQQSLGANAGFQQQANATNAAAQNTAGATNAAALQAAAQQNAAARQSADAANSSATNTARSTNAGYQQQALGANQSAANTAAATNASAVNAARSQGSQQQQQTNLTNAGFQQDANAANAQSQNAASAANASAYGTVVQGNENAYNAYQQWLAQQSADYGQSLLSAYLGSYGTANPSALATLGQAPGQVGAAYTNGLNSSAGPGLGAGFSSLVNAFTGSNGSNAPSFITNDVYDVPGGGGGGGGASPNIDPSTLSALGY